MATRFGATPAHTYATKVRWLVGCLISLIAFLIVAFVIVAQQSEAPASSVDAPADAVVNPGTPAGASEVIVLVNRIERGTRFEEYMFTSQMLDESKVPFGAIRKKDQPAVLGKFASRMVDANSPLMMDAISDSRPINAIDIPPGYRAVTITVSATTGVDLFVTPNSRVDVLWTFTQSGKQQVMTLVKFTKVLAVAGATSSDGTRAAAGGDATTVTLLVTEKDSKKIELARTYGTLSLTLVGGEEQGVKPAGNTDDGPIDIPGLLQGPANVQVGPAPEADLSGTMISVDPRTGQQVRFKLQNNKWVRDRSFGGESEAKEE